MNTICPKCFAAKDGLKCDFCGCEEIISEKISGESNLKVLAEREFNIGNFSAALDRFEKLYTDNPNDIFIIAYRSICLFYQNMIRINELSGYL